MLAFAIILQNIRPSVHFLNFAAYKNIKRPQGNLRLVPKYICVGVKSTFPNPMCVFQI